VFGSDSSDFRAGTCRHFNSKSVPPWHIRMKIVVSNLDVLGWSVFQCCFLNRILSMHDGKIFDQ